MGSTITVQHAIRIVQKGQDISQSLGKGAEEMKVMEVTVDLVQSCPSINQAYCHLFDFCPICS